MIEVLIDSLPCVYVCCWVRVMNFFFYLDMVTLKRVTESPCFFFLFSIFHLRLCATYYLLRRVDAGSPYSTWFRRHIQSCITYSTRCRPYFVCMCPYVCVCVCGYWDGKTGTLIFDRLLIVSGGCLGDQCVAMGWGRNVRMEAVKGKFQ